jgi:hypothetical protein
VTTVLADTLQSKHPQKTERVMAALMQMKKLDIAALKRAFEQQEPGSRPWRASRRRSTSTSPA